MIRETVTAHLGGGTDRIHNFIFLTFARNTLILVFVLEEMIRTHLWKGLLFFD
jgi:hypothetical protein